MDLLTLFLMGVVSFVFWYTVDFVSTVRENKRNIQMIKSELDNEKYLRKLQERDYSQQTESEDLEITKWLNQISDENSNTYRRDQRQTDWRINVIFCILKVRQIAN